MHEWDGFTNYQRNIGCMRAMFNWKEETKKTNGWDGLEVLILGKHS